VQSLSWTTLESVGFDKTHRTSFDWSAYPDPALPGGARRVEVHVIDRPGQPFLGAGEAAQGRPPRRSPTPSRTRWACECATCRCRRRASGRRSDRRPRRHAKPPDDPPPRSGGAAADIDHDRPLIRPGSSSVANWLSSRPTGMKCS
jgi:hypothetical protein